MLMPATTTIADLSEVRMSFQGKRRARGQSSDGDAEGLLLEAHLLFDICKRLIKGPGVAVAFREDQRYGVDRRRCSS